VGCILAEIVCCQAGRRQPFFGGDPENPNKSPEMMVEEIFQLLGKPTDETWPGLSKLPLFKTFTSPRVTNARPHKERGEERAFVQKFFLSGEGKPANSKYCLTENCFDLLGGLFTLCPAHRSPAAEALKHDFFTKEKPLPQWHAWHWTTLSSEIPRGKDMKKQADEGGVRKMIKQLSQEELKTTEDGTVKGGAVNGTSSERLLEQWRAEAERRKQAEAKRAAERARVERKTGTVPTKSGGTDDKLPPGWTKHWSNSKQRYYYHDVKSGKNSWNEPGR